MIKSFGDEVQNAVVDSAVGIAIFKLVDGEALGSYGTRMHAGSRVGCHSHSEGDEWYIILDGEGVIHLADVGGSCLSKQRKIPVKKGDIFVISPKTAHQLEAKTDLELLFLCPPSHLEKDRTSHGDLF